MWYFSSCNVIMWFIQITSIILLIVTQLIPDWRSVANLPVLLMLKTAGTIVNLITLGAETRLSLEK